MIGFDNPAAFFFLLALPVFFYLRSVKVFSRVAFPLTISDWNGSSFSWNNSVILWCTIKKKFLLPAEQIFSLL